MNNLWGDVTCDNLPRLRGKLSHDIYRIKSDIQISDGNYR